MNYFRVAALLYQKDAASPEPYDTTWFKSYLFELGGGIAAYWFQQTNTNVAIVGDVFDWGVMPDSTDYTNRAGIVENAMQDAHDSRGIDFSSYDCVCVVIENLDSTGFNAGSTDLWFAGKHFTALVIGNVQDGSLHDFGFVAHEFGHQLGLQHSYGNPNFRSADWAAPGEYGDPFCVMSAESYGGQGHTFTPDGADAAHSNQPPGLNGATRLFRGWTTAFDVQLPVTQPVDFGLMSLGSSSQGGGPRVINLHAANGDTYTVEFRHPSDTWDRGINPPTVVIHQGNGSTADHAHPDTGSATYLGAIALPVATSGQYRNRDAGFSVTLVDWPWELEAKVRIGPWDAFPPQVGFDIQIDTQSELIADSGEFDFANTGFLCLSGTYPWTLIESRQVATCQCDYAPVNGPAVGWQIRGNDGFLNLVGPSGTIEVSVQSELVLPIPSGQTKTIKTEISYSIEPTPNGSVLQLYNNPADGVFVVQVQATIARLGWGEFAPLTFEGQTVQWGGTYEQDIERCLARLSDFGRRHEKVAFVWPIDRVSRVAKGPRERIRSLQAAYAGARDAKERAAILGLIARITGTRVVPIEVAPPQL